MEPTAPQAVPCCPACGRRAASIRVARCLFCGAPFGSEISDQLGRLRERTPEQGSAELRRALLLGFGASHALPRPARRRRNVTVLVAAVLILGLMIFGAGALYLMTSRGGVEIGPMIGSVRNLATLAGALAVIAVVVAFSFVLGRRWSR